MEFLSSKNKQLISQKIPKQSNDRSAKSPDVFHRFGLIGQNSLICPKIENESRDAHVKQKSHNAHQQKLEEIFFGAFSGRFAAAESPRTVPKITVDRGDYERKSFLDHENRNYRGRRNGHSDDRHR